MSVPPSPTNGACAPHWRADLPRWRHLVPVSWLACLLGGQPVPAAPAGHWRLFEVHDGPWQPEHTGHIPASHWLDTNLLEQPPLWNKVPDALLLQRLPALGIRHDTTVILTGRHQSAAARAAQLLMVAGVSDVRLLDGGTAAWRAAGLPLRQGAPAAPVPVAGFGLHLPARPHWLIDLAQARAALADPHARLVSIRSHDEYLGITSGYATIPARGDIAGALWGRAGDSRDMNSMRDYQDAAGRMKPAAEILAFWQAQGITPDRHTAFYCGTGWRASLAFFYAWLMGWDDISVYDGGWLEWSGDPVNPTIVRQPLAVADRSATSDAAADRDMLHA
ncbi:rhodanese-like domain-containing protein [Comamonadaceae bacterium G21597-S1]|nr:rhodanese-like domain-containing protein [Comamonadaceae bacterium G21597-S1]